MRELIRHIIREELAEQSTRLSNDEWIANSKKIHGDKYDYSLTDYQGRDNLVTMICPIHDKFTLLAKNAYRGCPDCNMENRPSTKLTTDEFIERARKVHGDKYDYSEVDYDGTFKEVKIICPTHGDFEQKPNTHLKGHGCSKCNNSRGENEISRILKNKSINFKPGKRFTGCTNAGTGKQCMTLPFDFYLPEINTCIEYDGRQHYEPVDQFGGEQGFLETQARDRIKNKYCEDNGIELIRVPYTINMKEIGAYLSKHGI